MISHDKLADQRHLFFFKLLVSSTAIQPDDVRNHTAPKRKKKKNNNDYFNIDIPLKTLAFLVFALVYARPVINRRGYK